MVHIRRCPNGLATSAETHQDVQTAAGPTRDAVMLIATGKPFGVGAIARMIEQKAA
ncbi:hypothetical protein ACIQW5_29250 [Methylorubrum thiocyanatum]|uniref:hypothetical protein n=1 Tax=Methylorubrum thiocyanatum TaxID=47958 RepID=UPI00383B6E06